MSNIRFFITLIKRISDLESPWLFDGQNIIKSIEYIDKLIKENDNEINICPKYISILKRNDILYDFIKAVKWSAMATDEESKCFRIKNFAKN